MNNHLLYAKHYSCIYVQSLLCHVPIPKLHCERRKNVFLISKRISKSKIYLPIVLLLAVVYVYTQIAVYLHTKCLCNKTTLIYMRPCIGWHCYHRQQFTPRRNKYTDHFLLSQKQKSLDDSVIKLWHIGLLSDWYDGEHDKYNCWILNCYTSMHTGWYTDYRMQKMVNTAFSVEISENPDASNMLTEIFLGPLLAFFSCDV